MAQRPEPYSEHYKWTHYDWVLQWMKLLSCIQNTVFSFQFTKGNDKLECNTKWGCRLLGSLVNYTCIQNTVFSLQLTNGPNKLECYIEWSCSLLGSFVNYTMKRFYAIGPIGLSRIQNTTKGHNKLECYIIWGCSLLNPLVNYARKRPYNIGPETWAIFRTLFRTLQMDPISLGVTLSEAVAH
jgi:hypothetical protein